MKIKFLQAFNGDSILINYKDGDVNRNILVDGGTPRTYQRHLKPELESLVSNNELIDLLIITHIDDDHIGGIKELYQETNFDRSFIKNVWFNSGILLSDFFNEERDTSREVKIIMDNQTDMSVGQGISLENALKKEGNWQQDIIYTGVKPIKIGKAQITILSPDLYGLKKLHNKWETETDSKVTMSREHDDFDKPISELITKQFSEDTAIPNSSSIAFLIEHEDSSGLFLGDAHPSVVEKSLRSLRYNEKNKLKVNVVKISHHSSKKNTSPTLLSIIESDRFVILTDGSKHGLPDKQAIARVIASNNGCNLYFNYNTFIDELFLK